MAPIPLTNKIHTTTQHVPTTNLGSALANSDRAAYTIQELADTITLGTYLPLAGGTMTGTITMATGDVFFNDNQKGVWGNGSELQIYYDGTDTNIYNGGGDLVIRQNVDAKDILFKCDDGAGGETEYLRLDGGITSLVANVDFLMAVDGNGGKIKFGASQDLQIYHNGSNSYIENYTNDLILKNNAADKDMVLQCDDGTGTGVVTYLRLDGDDVSVNIETIILMMPNLPTTDPGGTGQVWNDSGTLKIT